MEKRATGDVTSRGAPGSISSSRCQTTRARRQPSFDGPQVESARISGFHERVLKVGSGGIAIVFDRNVWWSQTGSNRRPPACKAGALPTELWPRIDWLASCSSRQLAPPAFAEATAGNLRDSKV